MHAGYATGPEYRLFVDTRTYRSTQQAKRSRATQQLGDREAIEGVRKTYVPNFANGGLKRSLQGKCFGPMPDWLFFKIVQGTDYPYVLLELLPGKIA